jgi:hypothetical protein
MHYGISRRLRDRDTPSNRIHHPLDMPFDVCGRGYPKGDYGMNALTWAARVESGTLNRGSRK